MELQKLPFSTRRKNDRRSKPVIIAAALVVFEGSGVTVLDTTGKCEKRQTERWSHLRSLVMKRTFLDTCKLRGVALNADLLAKTLAVTGAIAVSDENILVALELAHKLVPCGLHGLAVPTPFVFGGMVQSDLTTDTSRLVPGNPSKKTHVHMLTCNTPARMSRENATPTPRMCGPHDAAHTRI